MKRITILILATSFFTIQSCKKEDSPTEDSGTVTDYEGGSEQNESKVSTYNSLASHNTGQNCMSCHKSGGTGEGWFNVAGSVYDSTQVNAYPNTTVKLYTGPGGTGALKYTIQVDGRGNFYTTNAIDFSAPLYPAVTGGTSTQYMGGSISTGECMSCHNNTTGKIWTK